MSGPTLVGLTWTFPKLGEKLRRAREEINVFIAAQMQFNRGMLFDKEGGYNGHKKWKPLILRAGMPLSARGTLRKSIAPMSANGRPGPSGIVRFTAESITIGTTLLYARMMNDGTAKMPGGVLRPVRAKALKIPVPQGVKAGPGAKAIQREAMFSAINARFQAKMDRMTARLQKAKTPESQFHIRRGIDKLRAERGRAESEAAERASKGRGPVNFIFRKSVRIPARPFDTWTAEDQQELEIALRNKIVEVLNR